jgi:hypothetical protein
VLVRCASSKNPEKVGMFIGDRETEKVNRRYNMMDMKSSRPRLPKIEENQRTIAKGENTTEQP